MAKCANTPARRARFATKDQATPVELGCEAMKAVLVDKPSSVSVATVDDPTPGPRELVLQIDGCGICGTDIHLIDGELPYYATAVADFRAGVGRKLQVRPSGA